MLTPPFFLSVIPTEPYCFENTLEGIIDPAAMNCIRQCPLHDFYPAINSEKQTCMLKDWKGKTSPRKWTKKSLGKEGIRGWEKVFENNASGSESCRIEAGFLTSGCSNSRSNCNDFML